MRTFFGLPYYGDAIVFIRILGVIAVAWGIIFIKAAMDIVNYGFIITLSSWLLLCASLVIAVSLIIEPHPPFWIYMAFINLILGLLIMFFHRYSRIK